jgi:hypothetical protein
VVEAQGAQLVTVASSPAVLVPMRLHERMLLGQESWDELSALPDERWRELAVLHQKLGGKGGLEEVRALLGDAALRERYDGGDRKAKAAARAESLRRLDPSAGTAAYVEALVRAAQSRRLATPVPEAGPWTESLCCLALYLAQNDPDDEPRRDEESWAAWRVTHQWPGLDSARAGLGLVAGYAVSDGAELGVSAAKVVVKRPPAALARDPLRGAIDRLAQEPGYDGGAHLEAAEALERAGDAEGAYRALVASTYWDVVAHGQMERDTLELALALARRSGWRELAGSLEVLASMRQDVSAEVG